METPSRSPVLHAYAAGGFDIGEFNGMQIALAGTATPGTAGFIADLSAIPKRLIAGAGAREFLAGRGVEVPAELLSWRPFGVDGAVVHLHRGRYLVIDSSESDQPGGLFELETGSRGDVLVLDYEAADFALGGAAAEAIVRELCPMNLAGCAGDAWIATRLAHCEVGLRRAPDAAIGYRLTCTPADAVFLFGILADVVRENGGTIAGLNDYLGLLEKGASK